MKKVFIVIVLISVLFGCDSTNDLPYKNINISEVNSELKIIRLDKEIFKVENESLAQELMNKYPKFTDYYLKSSSGQYKPEKALLNHVKLQDLDILAKEGVTRMGDVSIIEKEISDAFKAIKIFYPENVTPEVVWFVTNFADRPLYISKDFLYAQLDVCWFNDSTSRWSPPVQALPKYIHRHFKQDNVAPKLIAFWAGKYAMSNDKDKTLLNDMIYAGKMMYFIKQMMVKKDNHYIIEYTKEQYDFCTENEKKLWEFFLGKKILYTEGHFEKRKYIDPRPSVTEINKNCPGRIAQWFGWRIVESYMNKHKEVSLQELMNNTNSKKIFMNSDYNPQ